MTKLNLIKTALVTMMAATMAVGCSGELPTALNSADISTQNSFAQNGDFNLEGYAPEGQFERKGQHRFKGPKKVPQADFGAELNLSEEQKAELQALESEARAYRSENKPEDNHQAVKSLIDEAFASDNFDVDALKASLEEYKPDNSDALTFQAEQMIKRHQILTEEQKVTLKEKQAEREAKMSEFEGQRPGESGDRGIEKLTQMLNLSSEQQVALKAVQADKKPDFEAMKVERQASREAIQAELDKATPSVDNLVVLLQADRPENRLDKELDKLNDLHSILSAEQRETFSQLQTKMGPPQHGGPAGPSRGQHFGKPGMGNTGPGISGRTPDMPGGFF